MYDTDFFIKTAPLKKQIILKSFKNGDKDMIYNELEKNRNSEAFLFNIETTSVCNMHCIMCQRTTDMKRKPGHMRGKTFNSLVEQLEPQKEDILRKWKVYVDKNLRESHAISENNFYFDILCETVTLHGFGEPLLDPYLPKRVEMLTKKSIPTYFSCNPCNINLGYIEKLLQSGIGYIKFAIDSLDDLESKEIRGAKTDFTDSYRNVLEVLKLKEKYKVSTIIIMAMLDFYDDSSIANKFLQLWKDKDVYAYIKSMDNKWLMKRKDNANEAQGRNISHYKKQYCEFAWTSMTILEDGSVVPCTQDINGLWTFGNINRQSLNDIWNSNKYKQFRHLQLSNDFPEDFMCHSKCDLNIISDFYRK